MKVILLMLSCLLCFIAACGAGYVVNMNEQTDFPEGRELFVSKCNSCHQLYSPNQHTKIEWDSILVTMKNKAKISNEQKNEIYNWILEQKDNYQKSMVKKQIL